MRWLLGVAGLVGAFLVAGAVFEYFPTTPEAKAKKEARAAINRCWQSYARKSFDEAQKRFVASICETEEQKFHDKYGVAP